MSEITVQGVVQASRIEIPAPPGFSEGQVVSVTVKPIGTAPTRHETTLSPGILDAFGMLSEEESRELDQAVEELRRLRKLERKDQFS